MRKYIAFAELPEIERQIGKRVRAARTKFQLSQSRLAPILGLTRDQLNNIEIGRVALRFEPGWALCSELNLNPLWLAFADPEQHGFVDISASETFGDALFSRVVDDLRREDPSGSRPDYRAFREQTLGSSRGGLFPGVSVSFLAKWLNQLQPQRRADFWKAIHRSARGFIRADKKNVNQSLTILSELGNIGSMKLQKASLWPRLRDRIRKVVRKRGMKAMVARDIGVSRQAINALLSARLKKPYVPSAEYTLRLLEWVKAAEARQKRAPEVRSTRPARKTRTRKKSKHEKSSSDRKKQ